MNAATSLNVPQPYDALLLDFGGVGLLNPVELHSKAEQMLGLDPGALDWFGPVRPDTDPLWRQMIEGNLTERDYWAQRADEIATLAGRNLSLQDYMRLLYDPPTAEIIRPEAEAVVDAARSAGLNVSVLTNDMRAVHGHSWERRIRLLQTVDHIVDCSETGILKPDPQAYQRAVDIIGAAPERTLFVDDQPINIEGAERFGMATLWFDVANSGQSWQAVADRLGITFDSARSA